MCLIPGLADGRLLIDDALMTEHDVTDAWCACGDCHHHDEPAADGVTRRGALRRAVASAAGFALASAAGTPAAVAQQSAPPAQTPVSLDPAAPAQVVFLGTNGGPIISPRRSQPSSALIVNGIVYLVDAGGDVLWQLIKAQIPMPSVRHLFITHFHSDHVAGYPALASLGWIQSPPLARLDVWGPTVRAMHRSMRSLWDGDIRSREFVAGQAKFDRVVHGHDVNLERGNHTITKVFEDRNVDVSAIRVFHGSYAEMPYANAYRFDIKSGRSAGKAVVFSGDTVPTDGMSRFARDCDLMVHEAIYLPGIEQLLQSVAPSFRDGLRKHILSTHTNVADIPKVVKNANAKRVVLSHIGPGFTPAAVWTSTAQASASAIGFNLDIAVASDLDVVTI
jgi:ribonuclease BN (tRNA processing enzyme)